MSCMVEKKVFIFYIDKVTNKQKGRNWAKNNWTYINKPYTKLKEGWVW